MTEDILYLSKSSSTDYLSSSGATGDTNSCDHSSKPPISEQAKRVGRLTEYKANHPACCLVDHPAHVQALMSRSEIARILSKCLDGVTTRSGIPASTPRFVVVKSKDLPQIQRLADTAPFTFPMIVKPLPAAGTKASHHMMVVLNRHGLRRVHFPCILQEYKNHGGCSSRYTSLATQSASSLETHCRIFHVVSKGARSIRATLNSTRSALIPA